MQLLKDMKPLFNCELRYFPSPHLNQIYDGFEKLRKAGIINLLVKREPGKKTKPLLKVLINNKHKVIYDTLDGLNWINGSIEDNLDYFSNNIDADFYFKRSFNQQIIDNAPENCKVFPLGFNYPFTHEGRYPGNLPRRIKRVIRNNPLISKYYGETSFNHHAFEFYPFAAKENKILFITKLWDPDDASNENSKIEREQINKSRINIIRKCKKEFGENFIGGLQYDNFSNRQAKELLLPLSVTRKGNYLKIIKECNICIATTGLHNSIGWKFGEYIAASRAVVSEPLKYRLPGDFQEGKNYFEFNNDSELLMNIENLIKSKTKSFDMMYNNYKYYNNYLQPDKLILNTLMKIYQN